MGHMSREEFERQLLSVTRAVGANARKCQKDGIDDEVIAWGLAWALLHSCHDDPAKAVKVLGHVVQALELHGLIEQAVSSPVH